MKWLSLRIGGRKVGVFIVREKHPKLEGNNGMYIPDAGAIYLSRDLEDTALQDTLLHELEHAVNDISGANATWQTDETPDAVEEKFVRARTTVWHRLLIDLGFKFPERPNA